MSLSVPPAPLARARAVLSVFSHGPSGGKPRAAFVSARTPLLALMGRLSVDAACGNQDRHRVEHRYGVGRPVDVVLTDDVPTASTPTDDALLQPQRMPSVDPLVQQGCTVAGGAVDRSRAPDAPASPTVLPRKEGAAVRDHIESLDSSVRSQEGRVLGVRRGTTAAATRTVSSTLVVAGLIGLLGVCWTAASIAHGVTGPVSRAVRVLRQPEKSRRGHRRRPSTFHELRHLSPAVHAADDEPLGAARQVLAEGCSIPVASEGSTETSGPSSAGTRRAGRPSGSLLVTRSAARGVAHALHHTQLVALDATTEGAPFDSADPSASLEEEPAEEAAETLTAGGASAASSMATTRYAAARSRAIGPTTALWHAVDLERPVGAIGGTCETTLCGSLVRVSTDQRWPVPARDVCPTCSTLAH